VLVQQLLGLPVPRKQKQHGSLSWCCSGGAFRARPTCCGNLHARVTTGTSTGCPVTGGSRISVAAVPVEFECGALECNETDSVDAY
jgi:hypothetical protein